MMRLLIDGVVCEAAEAVDLALNYRVADLSDIDSGREGQHVIFTLPASLQNDAIFGYAADPECAERFNEAYHKASVEVEGAEVFSGTAYLDGVEISDGGTLYRVEIVGGATQWAKQVARTMFNLTNLDFEVGLTMAEIQDSWTNDSPVKFLPIQREPYDPHNGQTMVYAPEKILTPEDYHPFISVVALMRAMFKSAGYEVKSDFLESDVMRSLYMSGTYTNTDLGAKLQRMDFRAGRLESASAQANYAGRVYASPAFAANSVGNLVDITASEVVNEEGGLVATNLFSLNDCFEIDDDGFIAFRPLTAVKVGFEYDLKLVCDYLIESREWLKSFDCFYAGDGVSFPLRLSNRFEDCRPSLIADFEYRAVIFGYSDQYEYRINYKLGGVWYTWANITAQTGKIVSTADIAAAEEVVLQRMPLGGGRYAAAPEDWALYEGHINFEGSMEVELKLRTPAVEVTPSSPKRFDSLYFGGAEEGMTLTILPGTTMRPVFTSTIGYGSWLTFEDVAHIEVRQGVLLDVVRQMFNLRFFTDERLKVVYIEPYDDFMHDDELFDWSDRIDYSQPVVIGDIARTIHEQRTLGFRDEDSAVSDYNSENETELGKWSFEVAFRAAIEGEERLTNPLFAPTVSQAGGYENADSAQLMQIYADADELGDMTTGFTPRIVRYVGMVPLADGEQWSYPYSGAEYPLAAFHLAAGAGHEAISLCFEDRDGCVGLHSYYDRQFAAESALRRVSLTMHIRPDEFEHLFHFVEGEASIRSTFVLTIQGATHRYHLHSIEGYDPTTGMSRCCFDQI